MATSRLATNPDNVPRIRALTDTGISKFFGVPRDQVRDWVGEAIISPLGTQEGMYSVIDSCRLMARWVLKAQSEGAVNHEKDPRLKKWDADAEMSRFRLEEMKGNLINVEKAASAIGSAIASCRQTILGIPSSLRARYPDIDQDILLDMQAMLIEALEDAAETDIAPGVIELATDDTDEDEDGSSHRKKLPEATGVT